MRTIHLYESSSRSFMGKTFGKETARVLLDHVLPRAIEEIEAEPATRESTPGRIYSAAVRAVVFELLSDTVFRAVEAGRSTRHRGRISLPWIHDCLGALDPGEVGKLYEYARGFTFEESGAAKRRIVRCAGAKRNQGLFYTPEAIVRQIVSKTLDALELKRLRDLLDIRILDPSVGTGLFLAEALDQLTPRILNFQNSRGRGSIQRFRELKERATRIIAPDGVPPEISDRLAVRIHLATTCLYGVDLDPVAVAISRAALWNRIATKLPLPQEIKIRIRTGNSLIGQQGEGPGSPSKEDEHFRHAAAYFGTRDVNHGEVMDWAAEKGVLHWPHDYPEIFQRDRPGFDAIVGNPPYEIMSVKESGIEERRREQAYFRRMYRTCSGKINTYRLMLERSMTLLRQGGSLGFIVPATLLADASASPLRMMILDQSEVLQAAIVPEKARAFKGVTQAYLVLVTRKGKATQTLSTVVWDGKGEVPGSGAVEIERTILDNTDSRIPLLRGSEEKALLEALLAHPPLRGGEAFPAVGKVHQGEINMTTHKRFLTDRPTTHRLVRGEHIQPFRVVHPSSRRGRWDWVAEDFIRDGIGRRSGSGSKNRGGAPWNDPRIVLGRVVNMGTRRRLKAALVSSGTLLGDMTNYICDLSLPSGYLIGLLNSRLLNWRIKLTSTNNYLSASEVEALPVPRVTSARWSGPHDRARVDDTLARLAADPLSQSLEGSVRLAKTILPLEKGCDRSALLAKWIEHLADRLRGEGDPLTGENRKRVWNLLDALVVELFRVESLVKVLVDGE